ncbi:hypothetical protein OQA88_4734 [Cercophora sp. LCS_1]
MASEPMSVGSSSMEPPAPPTGATEEVKHGGYTRFELELEASLGNPKYLNHLASRKLLTNPSFIAYLDYLQHWSRPPYIKYLTYPGPALKNLQLLQQEKFRQDIISPDLVQAMEVEGMRAAIELHKES